MNNLTKAYHEHRDKIFILGAILMVILLPIQKVSTSIAFVVLCVGFVIGTKEFKITQSNQKLFLVVLTGYYVLHVISSLFSTYTMYAKNDLWIKAPLLILPLIFSLRAPLASVIRKTIWRLYLASTLLVSLFLYLRIIYCFILNHRLLSNVELVDYTIIHPSYLACYLLTGAMAMWLEPSLNEIKEKKNLISMLSTLILIAILFLGSRIIIVLSILFLVYLIFSNLSIRKSLGSSAVLLIMIAIVIWKVPALNERFGKGLNMFTQSSLEVNQYTVDDRLMTWKNTLELIKDKPFFGYTNGDYCYHYLKEKHNSSGFGKGYRQRLNAHNQVLESQLSMGILGSILFLTLFGEAFWIAWSSQHKMMLGFLIVCFSFAMVESIFQSQGGVMFFGFFIGLFLNELKHIRS